MVTHDPTAAAVADRVLFLRDGMVAGEVEGGSTAARDRLLRLARAKGRAVLRSFDGLALRQLKTRPLRAVLTAFGVVLGVGMVFGVLLLVGTIRFTFDN